MFIKNVVVAGIGLLGLMSSAFALTPVELLSSEEKGIKFQAKHTSSGSAYEAQTTGESFAKHLDSLNYKSAYTKKYLDIVVKYEDFLESKVKKDDWAKYSPELSMIYPDKDGQVVIANVQLEVPVFYQTVIFSYDDLKDRYSMRDRFLKRIMDQNCKRLETGIDRYPKDDWSEYQSFVKNLANTITFKFKNDVSVTVLSTCPSIDWSDYNQ